MNYRAMIAALLFAAGAAGCGGGGGGSSPTFTVGGTVTGLAGSGLTLQLNGGSNLGVAASGAFTFMAQLGGGAAYAVSVLTQPAGPSQTCTVANASGTVSGNVTSVAITCGVTVGGNVTGLSGSGLVVQNNGGNNLAIAANGPYTFSSAVVSAAGYNVTVLVQPAVPSQTCVVSNGTGTAGSTNIINADIGCSTNSFTIGGNVSGLAGSGLVLQDNGGNNLAIAADGSFTFTVPVLSGATYAVTVLTQPSGPSQNCTVANGSGTVGAANVTNVSVSCLTTFTISSLGDPLATQQWHLKNTGQNAFADTGGTAGMDIDVDPVFSNLGITGANVTVAVVDTGMEIAHEDLSANVVPGGSWNFNNSTTDPTNTVDTNGDHGTSVSGLIAMARNTLGGIGVAPRARLKGFNFLSSPTQSTTQFVDSLGGSTSNPNSSDVFVFNQSFGVDTSTPIVIDPFDESVYLAGVTNLRGGKGALYVKAAGNGFNGICPNPNLSCENANFDPDNTIPYQIVVGAVNADGTKSSYSSAGSAIWVSAPGGEFGQNNLVSGNSGVAVEPAMVTTDQSDCTKGLSRTAATTSFFDKGSVPNTQCNYTNTMNGTSSATPVTAGVIALILEANPALTWRDVKHILASTSRKIDASRPAVTLALSNGSYVAEPAWTANHASPTPFNFHNWYGFGMVDASAAVNMAKTYNIGQLGTFANTGFISSGAINIAIPDNSVTGASSTVNVPANPVHVVEAVQIKVSVTHTFDGDLGIELVSPSGTRSVLKNVFDGYAGADNLNNQVFLSNAFYGENAVGSWTIKVVDGIPGITGTFNNWAVRVYGH